MYLWLLMRTDDVDYDETRSLVAIAANESDARMIAMTAPGNQADRVWNDADVTLVGYALAGVASAILLADVKEG